MKVFKLYFKIIRANLGQIFLYIGIFMGLAVMFTFTDVAGTANSFESTSVRIAIIDRDERSELVEGLHQSLARDYEMLELEDDEEQLQDELFYRNVQYIIIVPAGYAEAFGTVNARPLQTVIIPDSTQASYTDMAVGKYLSTVELYQNSGMSITDAVAQAKTDFESESNVQLKNFTVSGSDTYAFSAYYQFVAYVMVAIILLGISTIMMVFNKRDIAMRNQCSPVKSRSRNLQLILGHCVFAVGCWLVIVIMSVVLNPRILSSGLLPLMALNALCYTAVCAAIGFLAGVFIKSYEVQTGVSNVLSLGMSFLCGVFVPREVMSPAVLTFSQFLPAYWYVQGIDEIRILNGFSLSQLSGVLTSMGVQIVFAIALFAVGLVCSKYRKQEA